MNALGDYVRKKRQALDAARSGFSIRAVAAGVGMHHSYLSKLERGEHAPLSEERIRALADVLEEPQELLLALSGRLAEGVVARIAESPHSFLQCLESFRKGSPRDEPDAESSRQAAAEAERRELEARYRTFFEKNPTVQLLIDPESGNILEANAAACAFYGYDPEAIRQVNIAAINTLPVEAIKQEMRQAIAESRNFFNFTHRRKDGEIRDVEARSTPVMYRGRKLLHSLIIDVTDRNRALRSLQEEHGRLEELMRVVEGERARFKVVMDAMDVAVYVVQPESRELLFTNRRYRDLFGAAARPLCREMQAGEDCCIWCREQEFDCTGGDAGTLLREFYHSRLGRHFECRNLPIRWTDGSSARLVIMTDITDRKWAEDRLQESEQRYRDLVANAPVGIYTVNVQGDYLTINAAHAANYGFDSPEEMMATVQNSREVFWYPQERDRLLELLARQDIVAGYECQVRRKDGSSLWTSRTVRAVRNAEGEVTLYEAFVEDIQARKKAEQATENAHRQLLDVLEQLEAGVYVITPEDRRIIYANPYLEKVLGRPLVGCRADADILGGDAPCPFATVPDVFTREGDTMSRELRFSNGRWYLCNARISRWFARGEVVLVVATDISEMKLAEELQQEVDRVMRHDLKSPLSGIIALPDLLLADGGLDESQQEMLRAIREAGRKMLGLVNASLSLYKLETRQYEVMAHDVDILRELRAAQAELAEIIGRKRLHIACTVSGRPVREGERLEHAGDAVLLPFLFSNLLKNAVEAAPSGSIVNVAIKPGAELLLEIHNHGAVPEPVRERFFEKYVTHGKSRGTGLGTYSARLIAEAHGGSIAMQTSEEQGTTLRVVLPAITP